MCTATFTPIPKGGPLFGRTMDFSYLLEPGLFVVPRGYRWENALGTHQIRNQYRFIGIGQNISPLTFADGVNEMGFAAAALYFPGYAHYDSPSEGPSAGLPIAAIELVPFLLGMCANVSQAAAILRTIQLVGVKDSVTGSVAPLHWICADKGGACMVVEKTADALRLMENPIGVLTNSPDFTWQMANLRGYTQLSPTQNEQSKWGSLTLIPFGQGGGTFGLPGDYTPPSRFVKTAFQKAHTHYPEDRDGCVAACFHVLEGVSIPKGVVMTARGTDDYTQYTAMMDLATQEYFFKTYENSQIAAAGLAFAADGTTQIQSLGALRRPAVFSRLDSPPMHARGR